MKGEEGQADGIEYLPRKSDANGEELLPGRFIEERLVRDRSVLGAVTKIGGGKVTVEWDYDGEGRKLYPVVVDGRRFSVYLPQRRDATEEEV